MPDYRVMPDGTVRVMHLDLDRSWWNRADSVWESDVAEVENVMRQATGLQRVHKTHHWNYVELRVRKALVAQATVAVMMHFGKQSDSSLLRHNDQLTEAATNDE